LTTSVNSRRPNAWSQTLQTSKRHTYSASAFHRYHWFGVKLFPVGLRTTVEGYPKNAKRWIFFGSAGSAYATKFRNFHDSARPHLHFVGLSPKLQSIGLMVRYKYYRKTLSFWFGLEPPRRRSRPKSAHKCIPYNNRRLQNFIQIG